MIIDLQRRIQEAGRIRIGNQVQSNGKTRPAKLETFRLTSSDKHRIEQAAACYGGTPTPWTSPAGPQWEVITTTDSLNVIVPPSEMAFSQWYETWSAGGCQRRCDGATEQITDGPCLCDPDNRQCAIHTRLSVMIRDLPGLGVWRIDTSGYYAAVELSGAVQVIQAAAGRGVMLPARLRLEQRSAKRITDSKPLTLRFAVPILDVEITPAQLISGEPGAAQLTEHNRLSLSAGTDAPLTPVPADLPTGPQRSIAEQSAPPAPKPKRSNAAPEIPASGRERRTQSSSDEATRAQLSMLHTIFSKGDVDNRETRLQACSLIVGRDLVSSAELTKKEATKLIDTLQQFTRGPATFAETIAELIGTTKQDGDPS